MGELTQNFNVLSIVTIILLALTVGTALRVLNSRTVDAKAAHQHQNSLKTWWVLTFVTIAAVLLGRTASIVLFAVVSVLATHEFTRLPAARALDRYLFGPACMFILLYYIWIWWAADPIVPACLLLLLLLAASVLLILAGQTRDFVHKMGRMCFYILISTYCLAFATRLFNLPPRSNPLAGGAGWFLYLVVLTESNDITQALVGRKLGRHKVVPRVSPNKSWEGLVGGILATVGLGTLLARWLVPFDLGHAVTSSGLIAAAGFLGDLNMSAIKRDAGVKDTGTLLPGQGGILDRIDSLTFAAPLFYYYVVFVS